MINLGSFSEDIIIVKKNLMKTIYRTNKSVLDFFL